MSPSDAAAAGERCTLADVIGADRRDASGGPSNGVERLALCDRGIGTRRRRAEDTVEPELPFRPGRRRQHERGSGPSSANGSDAVLHVRMVPVLIAAAMAMPTAG